MSVKFRVEMKVEYMYDYLLYHNYTHASGIFSALAGIATLFMAIRYGIAGDFQYCAIWGMCAVLLLVANPSVLKSNARSQVKNVEMFQKPLEYELTEDGIIVRQEEQEAVVSWGDVSKVVRTSKSVFVYIGRIRALILPKECMGNQYEDVVKMICTHVSSKRVRGLK